MISRSVRARIATVNASLHLHARREVLELLLGEVLELCEGEDLVDLVAQLRARETEHRAAEKDVLARGELRIEADAELEERRELAVDDRGPAARLVDPAEDLQQRALAAAVRACDAEELTLGYVERDVAQRVEVAVPGRAPPVRDAVLQRRALVEREAETLAEMRDFDDRIHSASANFGVSRLKTTNPTTQNGDGEQDRDDPRAVR